ncbi:hypothetical protein AB0L53_57135 [Nonomuraea sp. NPDC052129]|uniref:hypothetical protein n=1 Tax=Nonomuraea sp. NPDC052129 TaxID=3154651 RepID=UPI003416F9EE
MDTDFEQYANHPFFRYLDNINEFAITAAVPPVGAPLWNDPKFISVVTEKAYDYLREVIKGSDFYYESELSLYRDASGFGVRYADDEYGFRVLFREGQILIRRAGSNFRTFHDWFTRFMSAGQGIVTKATGILSESCERRIDVLQASFDFEFIVYDITPEGSNASVRNPEIMKTLIKTWPGTTGVVSDDLDVLNTVARADFAVHRWADVRDMKCLERYSISAPANNRWNSLWFEFQLRGESYTDPENGKRTAFNPTAFLNAYDDAYITFLRGKAILGFMNSLLAGHRFKSTPSSLP